MFALSADRRGRRALPLTPVTREGWEDFADTLGTRQRRWAQACGFAGQAGASCMLPDARGDSARVLCGIDPALPPFALGSLPWQLPKGDYRLEGGALTAHDAALGWELGSYRFTRYRQARTEPARLLTGRQAQDPQDRGGRVPAAGRPAAGLPRTGDAPAGEERHAGHGPPWSALGPDGTTVIIPRRSLRRPPR